MLLTLFSAILIVGTMSFLSPTESLATGVNGNCGTTTAGDKNTVLDNAGDVTNISGIACSAHNVQNFLSGPLAQTITILAVIVCGGMWFMNRQAQNAQTLGRIGIGAALIFLAPQFFGILGFGAGIL